MGDELGERFNSGKASDTREQGRVGIGHRGVGEGRR
jgi:hypothetical protein